MKKHVFFYFFLFTDFVLSDSDFDLTTAIFQSELTQDSNSSVSQQSSQNDEQTKVEETKTPLLSYDSDEVPMGSLVGMSQDDQDAQDQALTAYLRTLEDRKPQSLNQMQGSLIDQKINAIGAGLDPADNDPSDDKDWDDYFSFSQNPELMYPLVIVPASLGLIFFITAWHRSNPDFKVNYLDKKDKDIESLEGIVNSEVSKDDPEYDRLRVIISSFKDDVIGKYKTDDGVFNYPFWQMRKNYNQYMDLLAEEMGKMRTKWRNDKVKLGTSSLTERQLLDSKIDIADFFLKQTEGLGNSTSAKVGRALLPFYNSVRTVRASIPFEYFRRSRFWPSSLAGRTVIDKQFTRQEANRIKDGMNWKLNLFDRYKSALQRIKDTSGDNDSEAKKMARAAARQPLRAYLQELKVSDDVLTEDFLDRLLQNESDEDDLSGSKLQNIFLRSETEREEYLQKLAYINSEDSVELYKNAIFRGWMIAARQTLIENDQKIIEEIKRFKNKFGDDNPDFFPKPPLSNGIVAGLETKLNDFLTKKRLELQKDANATLAKLADEGKDMTVITQMRKSLESDNKSVLQEIEADLNTLKKRFFPDGYSDIKTLRSKYNSEISNMKLKQVDVAFLNEAEMEHEALPADVLVKKYTEEIYEWDSRFNLLKGKNYLAIKDKVSMPEDASVLSSKGGLVSNSAFLDSMQNNPVIKKPVLAISSSTPENDQTRVQQEVARKAQVRIDQAVKRQETKSQSEVVGAKSKALPTPEPGKSKSVKPVRGT